MQTLMQSPFFSIIIPCYNSEDYIVETLESVRQQSFVNFEIILIDDHSSDKSFELAYQYFTQFNIVGHCLTKDLERYPKGVSGARNQGIDYAKGEWICFLDSDDLFLNQKLERLFGLIQKHQQIKAFHHAVLEFEDKTMVELNKVIIEKLDGVHSKLPELLSFNNICTSSVTLHKSLLNQLGNFDTKLNGIEDFYCWLKVSKLTKWYYSKEIFTKYRVRSESLMGYRKIPHYAKQNWSLLSILAKDKEFNKEEFKLLEKYLFKDIMKYYINNSVDKFGLINTTIDSLVLLKFGYFSVFVSNVIRIYKNFILNVLFR